MSDDFKLLIGPVEEGRHRRCKCRNCCSHEMLIASGIVALVLGVATAIGLGLSASRNPQTGPVDESGALCVFYQTYRTRS